MALRVKVQPTFRKASVWKLSKDEEFINQIKKDNITDEGSLSAFGESDLNKILVDTPTKDGSVSNDLEDFDCKVYGSTQFSGTKPSKKVKVEPKD
ncbi:hypothetical protein RYX36_002819 [Vicia faba]